MIIFYELYKLKILQVYLKTNVANIFKPSTNLIVILFLGLKNGVVKTKLKITRLVQYGHEAVCQILRIFF